MNAQTEKKYSEKNASYHNYILSQILSQELKLIASRAGTPTCFCCDGVGAWNCVFLKWICLHWYSVSEVAVVWAEKGKGQYLLSQLGSKQRTIEVVRDSRFEKKIKIIYDSLFGEYTYLFQPSKDSFVYIVCPMTSYRIWTHHSAWMLPFRGKHLKILVTHNWLSFFKSSVWIWRSRIFLTIICSWFHASHLHMRKF